MSVKPWLYKEGYECKVVNSSRGGGNFPGEGAKTPQCEHNAHSYSNEQRLTRYATRCTREDGGRRVWCSNRGGRGLTYTLHGGARPFLRQGWCAGTRKYEMWDWIIDAAPREKEAVTDLRESRTACNITGDPLSSNISAESLKEGLFLGQRFNEVQPSAPARLQEVVKNAPLIMK